MNKKELYSLIEAENVCLNLLSNDGSVDLVGCQAMLDVLNNELSLRGLPLISRIEVEAHTNDMFSMILGAAWIGHEDDSGIELSSLKWRNISLQNDFDEINIIILWEDIHDNG